MKTEAKQTANLMSQVIDGKSGTQSFFLVSSISYLSFNSLLWLPKTQKAKLFTGSDKWDYRLFSAQ